jgi:hypothetical protein
LNSAKSRVKEMGIKRVSKMEDALILGDMM